MLDILRNFFDTLLPPHPTILSLRPETPEKFLRLYSTKTFQNCVTLSSYKQGIIKSAIKANKFHNNTHASKLLAKLLEKWLFSLPEKPTVFVSIPLSSIREKERGYNQVDRILTNLAKLDNCLIKKLLIRKIDTIPQTKMDRGERLNNMTNVFAFIEPDIDLQSYRIVLVDDVITTGATMSSAHKILKENLPAGTEILCLALAH